MKETAMKCRICGNEHNNEPITLSERHLGLGDRFDYITCSNCGCMQIKDIPANMDRYYPGNYYSFDAPVFPSRLTPLGARLKRSLINHCMGYADITGFLLSFIYPHPFPWIRKREITFTSSILDVGAGAGRKSLSLHRSGFRNVLGIDPYINSDIDYGNGVKILKKNLSEINSGFDFIMLHHSFEHMPRPAETVMHLDRLLNPGGIILIRIPVAGCRAWELYGEYWYGLDAPRHFYIHSRRSIEILLENTNLKIDGVVFDSSAYQFVSSEKYLKGMTLLSPDEPLFTPADIQKYAAEAEKLNREGKGDTACFYIRKKASAK
ncbi:MAG: class I SAM-dependent methyltransferase [Bacteroidales bacterium]|jgi:SAM-dependent methyltransferase|nr:class I SAM-dependent methyltransferase [Bacteroidales bacterium]